jgi:hypothetical protein
MLLADGHLHEDQSALWLERMGYELLRRGDRVRKLVKLDGEPIFLLSGRLDGVISNVPPEPPFLTGLNGEDHEAIWEHKGLSTWTMKKKDPSELLYQHYKDQATLYMYMTGIPYTVFTLKDKNDSHLQFLGFNYSETKAKVLLKKGLRIATNAKQERLGEKAYERATAKPCSWCRHKGRCWG